MLNSMVMFICPGLDGKYYFWPNLVQKVEIACLRILTGKNCILFNSIQEFIEFICCFWPFSYQFKINGKAEEIFFRQSYWAMKYLALWLPGLRIFFWKNWKTLRHSTTRTFLYFKQKYRPCCSNFLPISNFLLACFAIQVSYRLISRIFLIQAPKGFRMWISECERPRGFRILS